MYYIEVQRRFAMDVGRIFQPSYVCRVQQGEKSRFYEGSGE